MNNTIESIKNRVLNQYDRDPPLEEKILMIYPKY